MRVENVVPSALERHQYRTCSRADSWRPELITPVLSFVTKDILRATERLRYVFMVDSEASPSRDVRIGLQAGELAMTIDPSVVILYDRTRASYFCLTVVEQDEILVQLDLTDLSTKSIFETPLRHAVGSWRTSATTEVLRARAGDR